MEEKEDEVWRENQSTIASTHLAEPNEPTAGNVRNQLESIQPEAEANVFFSLPASYSTPFFQFFCGASEAESLPKVLDI